MPNHTTNLLSIVAENNLRKHLKPYLSKNKADGSFLDFNKILPMPKQIEQTLKYGDMEFLSKKRTLEQEKRMREKQEKQEKECLELYGAKSWYYWSIQNWGTKWNSYSNRFFKIKKKQCLFFNTAWSPAEPVIRELSRLLNQTLRLAYLDEGYAFMGVQHFFPNGRVDDEYYDDVKLLPSDLKDELGITDDEQEQEEMEEMMVQVKAGQNK